jgi:hypothetical protein
MTSSCTVAVVPQTLNPKPYTSTETHLIRARFEACSVDCGFQALQVPLVVRGGAAVAPILPCEQAPQYLHPAFQTALWLIILPTLFSIRKCLGY